ncbi:MAG: glycosyltransferase family 2 protein [Myxococcota bacterium]
MDVVIPTLWGGEMLRACVASLLDQRPSPASVTIVANGTGAEVSARLFHEPPVRVIALPENIGFARAVNRGWRDGTQRWVLVLNDDVVLGPEFMAAFEDRRGTLPEEVKCLAAVLWEAGSVRAVHSAGLCLTPYGYGNRSQFRGSVIAPPRQEVVAPCGACGLYERGAMSRVGGFPEDFFFLFEDWEVGLRMQALGATCTVEPDLSATHVGSATLRQFPRRRLYEGMKNWLVAASRGLPNEFWAAHGCEVLSFARKSLVSMREAGAEEEVDAALTTYQSLLPAIRAARGELAESAMPGWNDRLEALMYRGPVAIEAGPASINH